MGSKGNMAKGKARLGTNVHNQQDIVLPPGWPPGPAPMEDTQEVGLYTSSSHQQFCLGAISVFYLGVAKRGSML